MVNIAVSKVGLNEVVLGKATSFVILRITPLSLVKRIQPY